MCELNLATLQCVTVKVLSILLVMRFALCRRSLGTCLSDGSALRSMYNCTERRKACFEENTLVACLLHHYE